MLIEELTGELAFAESVSSSATVQDAAAALFAYSEANGFNWTVYFPFYASGEPPQPMVLASARAPSDYFVAFQKNEFASFGPIRWTHAPVVRPFLLSELASLADITDAQTDTVTHLRRIVGCDAIFAPTFGPAARNGVVVFACGERAPIFTRTALLRIGWVAQTTHTEIVGHSFTRRYRTPEFTAREYDVYRCIVRGMSNLEIAEALTLSPNTVDTHIRRLFAKLGVNDRIAAIRQAVVNGLFYQLGGDSSDRIGRMPTR